MFDFPIHTELPLTWRTTPHTTPPAGADTISLLRLLSLQEAVEALSAPRDPEEKQRWELLELRTRIMLHTLGALLSAGVSLPGTRAVTLEGDCVRWRPLGTMENSAQSASPAAGKPDHSPRLPPWSATRIGEEGWLGLWLSPALPLPVWLPARGLLHEDEEALAEGAPAAGAVRLLLAPAWQDEWDKACFRFHRHEILHQREEAPVPTKQGTR